MGFATFYYTRGESGSWIGVIIMGIGVLLVILAILGYFFIRFELSTKGIKYYGIFGRNGFVYWSEITKISFSEKLMEFKIYPKNNKNIKITSIIEGINEFANAVIENVNKIYFEEEAYQTLKNVQKGKLPKMIFTDLFKY